MVKLEILLNKSLRSVRRTTGVDLQYTEKLFIFFILFCYSCLEISKMWRKYKSFKNKMQINKFALNLINFYY